MSRHRFEPEEFEEASTPEDQARRNIRWRRHLENRLVTFVAVSAFLVVLWALSGAGYFWPGWVMAGLALVLILEYWRYQRGPVNQADVDEEVRRMHSSRSR